MSRTIGCGGGLIAARPPCGAPPRYSPRRTHPDIGSALSPALPETRRIRALPSAACLSPPRSAETGRSAGRAVTRGRPGTVCETARGNRTCSTFWTASGMVPFDEQALTQVCIYIGDECQEIVAVSETNGRRRSSAKRERGQIIPQWRPFVAIYRGTQSSGGNHG